MIGLLDAELAKEGLFLEDQPQFGQETICNT